MKFRPDTIFRSHKEGVSGRKRCVVTLLWCHPGGTWERALLSEPNTISRTLVPIIQHDLVCTFIQATCASAFMCSHLSWRTCITGCSVMPSVWRTLCCDAVCLTDTVLWCCLSDWGGKNERFFIASQFSLERICLDADKLIIRILFACVTENSNFCLRVLWAENRLYLIEKIRYGN